MRLRHVSSVRMTRLVSGAPGLISGAVALGVTLPTLAQGPGWQGGPPFGPYPLGPHPFGPWLWAAGLFFLLRILLVTGLSLVVWRLLMTRPLWQRPDNAVQILRERYARGEISEDEYRKRAATLA